MKEEVRIKISNLVLNFFEAWRLTFFLLLFLLFRLVPAGCRVFTRFLIVRYSLESSAEPKSTLSQTRLNHSRKHRGLVSVSPSHDHAPHDGEHLGSILRSLYLPIFSSFTSNSEFFSSVYLASHPQWARLFFPWFFSRHSFSCLYVIKMHWVALQEVGRRIVLSQDTRKVQAIGKLGCNQNENETFWNHSRIGIFWNRSKRRSRSKIKVLVKYWRKLTIGALPVVLIVFYLLIFIFLNFN